METDWGRVKPEIKAAIGKKTDSLAGKILGREGRVGITLKTRGLFFIMSMMQKNGFNEADVKYWKDKGWTQGKRPWR